MKTSIYCYFCSFFCGYCSLLILLAFNFTIVYWNKICTFQMLKSRIPNTPSLLLLLIPKNIPFNIYILLIICSGFENIGLNKLTSLMCYIYVWVVGCNRECQECRMHNLYKLNSIRMGNIASI